MKKAFLYETKLGKILIAEEEQGITELTLLTKVEDGEFLSGYLLEETANIREAAKQLTEYLEGTRKEFHVKLDPKGTEFQRKVWKALLDIPYGETRTYKQIAEAVGNSKASRAVGMANHNNPIMCIIPCHRVIGANGSLVGYAGGLHIKQQLLNLEKERK